MSRLVVDASVAIKWYVPEVHHLSAHKVLTTEGQTLHAPDLIFAEFGNILWKKHRSGELTEEEVRTITDAFLAVPKTIHKSQVLLPSALEIAIASGRTLYDSLYLALAAELDCLAITADMRLYNGICATPWVKLVKWVED